MDEQLPQALERLEPGDILITADHGCDPIWCGSNHTGECVPILTFSPDAEPASFGRRAGFADIGQTIAGHLGIAVLAHGKSWL